jgi:hypothetical protein
VDTLGGNYFPMVMRANLLDSSSSLQFGVVSERTHGTASYGKKLIIKIYNNKKRIKIEIIL